MRLCTVLHLVAQSCLTLCYPMDYSLPDSSVHGILQARILEWVAMPSSRGSSRDQNPGIKPRFPTLQVDSIPSEPPGKPKDTGVVSLSLHQGNFPIVQSNRGLLHCRQILYWLSYLGSLMRLYLWSSFAESTPDKEVFALSYDYK